MLDSAYDVPCMPFQSGIIRLGRNFQTQKVSETSLAPSDYHTQHTPGILTRWYPSSKLHTLRYPVNRLVNDPKVAGQRGMIPGLLSLPAAPAACEEKKFMTQDQLSIMVIDVQVGEYEAYSSIIQRNIFGRRPSHRMMHTSGGSSLLYVGTKKSHMCWLVSQHQVDS